MTELKNEPSPETKAAEPAKGGGLWVALILIGLLALIVGVDLLRSGARG